MSEQLVYMFALITSLFRSLVQFCPNSSFICLLLLQVCSDPLYNFVWTARLYVLSVITVLFTSLYIGVWAGHSFISCHQRSVQVSMHYCLNRSFFIIYLLSSKVPSGPCESSSEQILYKCCHRRSVWGPCESSSEQIFIYSQSTTNKMQRFSIYLFL